MQNQPLTFTANEPAPLRGASQGPGESVAKDVTFVGGAIFVGGSVRGNLSVSLLVGIVIVFGAAAIGGVGTPLVWLVAAVATLVNAAREIIKDIEDEEGDEDRETLTKRIGPDSARAIAQMLVLLSLLPLVAPYARGLLPMGLLITQLPSMLALVSVKPRLYRGEDHAAQRTLRLAMLLGLAGFLASVLLPLQYSSL